MINKFHILVLNGPNMNMIGNREPQKYGTLTLREIIKHLHNEAAILNVELNCVQSNSESKLIECIHNAKDNADYILINPAAFTHTSIAIRDALLAVNIPFIEIHLSNVYAQEPYRHHSYFSDISSGMIVGMGTDSYSYALQTAVKRLSQS